MANNELQRARLRVPTTGGGIPGGQKRCSDRVEHADGPNAGEPLLEARPSRFRRRRLGRAFSSTGIVDFQPLATSPDFLEYTLVEDGLCPLGIQTIMEENSREVGHLCGIGRWICRRELSRCGRKTLINHPSMYQSEFSSVASPVADAPGIWAAR